MKRILSFTLLLMMVLTLASCTDMRVVQSGATFNFMNAELEPVRIKSDGSHVIPSPEKTGYTFVGWYLDADFENVYEEQMLFTESTTLYAQWQVAAYTMTFESIGGTPVQSLEKSYGDALGSLPIPERQGYVFSGWYADSQYQNYFIAQTMPANDVVLFARWVTNSQQDGSYLPLGDMIADMITQVETSFVGIVNDRGEENGSATGSGVIYKQEGNTFYVITNHHVLEDHESLSITYQRFGMLFIIEFDDITYIGSDPVTDIGVIRFESDRDFYAAELADSYQLRLGSIVVAMGNPLGFDNFGSVTMGIVSGLTRFKLLDEINTSFIQHDAAINRGNSGGPLFNLQGEVVGINTLKTLRDSRGDAAEGLGFAVPSNTVRRVINDLEEHGRVLRPFLGIIASAVYGLCGQEYGVCIVDIAENSAAEAAGLQAEDVIIGYKTQNEEDYTPVYNFDQLREVILNSRVGDTIQVRYERNGEVFESPEVVLGLHPDDLLP